MNKITVIGNLTKDPETRTTNSGTNVCTFSIASDRKYTPAGQDKTTDYFRIEVWGKQGDTAAKYLAKGRKVCIIGELQPSSYKKQDGTTGTALNVRADDVVFLSAPSKDEKPAASDHQAPAAAWTPSEDFPF